MVDFANLEFGRARAEYEGAKYPELLEKGYLDNRGAYATLEKGDKFLVLGFKGSGKSAIGEKLRIDAEAKKHKAVSIIHLEDFPFKSFSKIFSGASESESKYPTSWSWIILLSIIDKLRFDPKARVFANESYNNSIDELSALGLLPMTDLKKVVIQSSKNSFKVQIPKILEYAKETVSGQTGADMHFLAVVDYLKELVSNYSTEGGLILVIDGLDDILTKREVQYQALAALIFEVDRLNIFFLQRKKSIHIVLLCRTELYERLPGPNKNKLRQDSAFELNWYHDVNSPNDSNLVELINLRASLSAGEKVDVFDKWFPKYLDDKPIRQYLLEHTRHTPRDFVSLMNALKGFSENNVFSRKNILGGLRQYSIDYFLPEIRDEIVGYAESSDFDKFITLVGMIRQREFSFVNLMTKAEGESISNETMSSLLKALYDCSAIGNKWRTPNGSDRYEFRFRNRNSSFDKLKTIVLHKGLWKALNLI